MRTIKQNITVDANTGAKITPIVAIVSPVDDTLEFFDLTTGHPITNNLSTDPEAPKWWIADYDHEAAESDASEYEAAGYGVNNVWGESELEWRQSLVSQMPTGLTVDPDAFPFTLPDGDTTFAYRVRSI